ncbi:hypothetical protein CDD83_5624 [Cordyceps sp. RAO-2017]|nr:hypothetical protein CDD83_5624 [Cordyceps sp. RAO-2017]
MARKKLVEKADGMFQYVSCQFEVLRKCPNPTKMSQALDNLPKGLDETYNRILMSVEDEFKGQVFSVLRWLACSKVPLTVEEVAEIFVLGRPDEGVILNEEARLFQPDDVLKYLSDLCGRPYFI